MSEVTALSPAEFSPGMNLAARPLILERCLRKRLGLKPLRVLFSGIRSAFGISTLLCQVTGVLSARFLRRPQFVRLLRLTLRGSNGRGLAASTILRTRLRVPVLHRL
jgi:hypothetical protein